MNTRYKIFKWIRDLADKQMQKNYLKPYGGCDSCCPNCRKWESQGNTILTKPFNEDTDDGTDKRTCQTCSYSWRTVFTPAGHIMVEENK